MGPDGVWMGHDKYKLKVTWLWPGNYRNMDGIGQGDGWDGTWIQMGRGNAMED